MPTYKCEKGCCDLKIEPYDQTISTSHIRRRRRKAGVFIYDPLSDRILIVQSRGKLWGLPKGTVNIGETERNCAVREAKEEIGLAISIEEFCKAMKVKNRAIYFYLEREACEVKVQNHIPDNDANGVSWIKVDCIKDLIENGNIDVNRHCRMAFKRFINVNLPDAPTFHVVGEKKHK